MALSRRSRVNGDHPYVLLQKLTDHRVSVSITGLLLTSSLFARHGLCLILSLISTQWVVQTSLRSVRRTKRLLANTHSEEGLSLNSMCNSKGKYVFKVLPFGIANTIWIFQRVMSLAFANFGQPSDLLLYMDDVIACSATWGTHLRLLEDMFCTLQTAGLTSKPSKIHFGPKEVQYLGHALSANGIRIG